MSEQPRATGISTGVFPIVRNLTMSALRADDFLALDFEFINLRLSTPSPGKPVLTIVNSADPAFIVVTFPPQNIAEHAFWLAAKGFTVLPPDKTPPTDEPDPLSIAPSRIAGPSRIAFRVPANTSPIPYSLASLLEKCSELDPSIAPTAVAPFIRHYIEPIGALQTAGATPISGAAVRPIVPAPRPAPVSLASLMVEHRMALRSGRSLASRIVGASTPSIIRAVSVGPAPLVAPSSTQTAIEMPYRLIISPNQYGAWAHASAPISSPAGRTELWHTRLGGRSATGAAIDESAAGQLIPNLSAIWARDPKFTPDNKPSPNDDPPFTSLDASDRWQIVHQSYDHSDIAVNRMMLTSLGGWLDARGVWDDQEIQEWRHVATMGRDHYARVVHKGFLFPFGHRASLVKITERIFHPSLPGNPAYLRQRVFVMVRETEKLYPQNKPNLIDDSGCRFDLQMPFTRVRITTMLTPNLDPPLSPGDPPLSPGESETSFLCPRVDRAEFKFHLIAEDLNGNEIEFSAPLYYVDAGADADTVPGAPSILNKLIPGYQQRGICDFQGRRVPFAEDSDPTKPKVVKPGSATFEAVSVTFSAKPLHKPSELGWECHFYPAVTEAKIIVPALKHLAGNSGPGPVVVKFDDTVYLKHGFDATQNKGQVFLEMVPQTDPKAHNLSFSGKGDRSGGLVTPNMQITALSRLLGPVAGASATISKGSFDPADFFSTALDKALLFGTIPLTAVLKEVVGLDFDNPYNLPRFITEGMSKLDGLIQDVAQAQALITEIDNAAGALGSEAAALKVDTAAAAADLDALASDLQGLVKDPKTLGDFSTHLGTFCGDLQKLLGDLPAVDAFADAKRLLQQILSRFSQEPDAGAIDSILNTLLAEQLTIKFVWNPVIQPIAMDFAMDFTPRDVGQSDEALFVPKADSFKISVEMQVAKTAAEPAMDLYCGLRDFKLQLIPIKFYGSWYSFVTLHFDVLEFTVSAGKSPDVNVKLNSGDGITFGGPLSFVNTLEKIIPIDGFSDPPALSVTSAGIEASYSVGLPTIGIGVFSLQNMSLGAGFRVPFVVDPLEVDFNFCSREQPFLLTVSLFGGGGYFLMKATPLGVDVEAALEFGAAIAINLGVASGGVHVMAGIMFAMEGQVVTLGGFLKMGGNVDVLGIISASIELDMDLNWYSSGCVVGEATITVEISVLMFCDAVSISCQKQFAGSPQPASGATDMIATLPQGAAPTGEAAPSPGFTQPTARSREVRAAPAVTGAAGPGDVAPLPGAVQTPPPTFKDLMQPTAAGAPWHDYCRAFA